MDTIQTVRIFSVFKYIIYFIVIVIVFSNFLIGFYEGKGMSENLLELGKTFFLSTLKLSEESQKIIDNGGVIILKDGFMNTFLYMFKTYASLISSILMIIFWINSFAWIIGRSPFSDTGNVFRNIIMALFLFYIIQITAILSFEGLKGNIKGITGENSISFYLLLPFTCFKTFFFALKYILKPIVEFGNKINI